MNDRERDRRASDDPDAVDLDERKERVLHTRVPDSLDRHLKRRARNLGMSVSTVVRNVLLTTFGLVEDIVHDSADIALAATGHRTDAGRRRPDTHRAADTADVLAWQDAVLNRNAVCEECNAILPKGSHAGIGIADAYGPRAVVCPPCLARLAGPQSAAPKKVR